MITVTVQADEFLRFCPECRQPIWFFEYVDDEGKFICWNWHYSSEQQVIHPHRDKN